MAEGRLTLHGVSKRFRRGLVHDSLSELIASAARRLMGRVGPRAKEEAFWALRDVSFDAQPGETVGVIGPNGAGKSTALKLAAGILWPDTGQVHTRGRLTAMIELSAGFHGDLTGRENIYMNAAILGMRRREIDEKLDSIIDFSGISEFIDTPVKRYSSGMQARLGFSVAVHVDPDVLLVDEVLSVGDVAFRQRCIDRMRELVAGGAVLLFVTHHLEQMQSFCSRAIVLDHGEVVFDGPTAPAVARYIAALESDVNACNADSHTDAARVTGIRVLRRGSETVVTHAREPIEVEVRYHLSEPVAKLAVEVDVRREVGALLANFSSVRDEVTFAADKGDGCVVLSLPSLPLAAGQYFWSATLRDVERSRLIAADRHRLSTFTEDDGKPTGILCLPHEWRMDGASATDRSADRLQAIS